MKNHTKIFEMGAEGGSIALYQCIDAKNQEWYYHSTQEIGYEDLGIAGVDKTSKYSRSIGEAYIKMQGEYNNVMSLYPVMVHEDYKYIIKSLLILYVTHENKDIDTYNWANALGMDISELEEELKKI
ncbi:hypothetical protein ULMA_02430 [Patiriisocius marinus]|uniref:Uncharacterized protein n=1 Tax=Patiriisocius marinus TaxID=1397112 RepID=A0A5J4IM18_9FLAO|nr:hypothetical protein [Patiriisocius marinus]GER58135.1 hypothetical protein ULMA_02430 [Patiriisocius marinus]